LQKVLDQVEEKDFENKIFGVVGLGQVVGLPIKNFLEEKNYQVATIGKGEETKMKDCDVLISGVGEPFFIKVENIKTGAVLVDYGCSFITDPRGSVRACGDFDQSCFAKASYYTPVPGCMGPLVVASLFENVLKTTK
jgi:methylenetetrahydrofolate dehydrogenase (NADP+)/methenyltetrahydrofolate cyclohydrolase